MNDFTTILFAFGRGIIKIMISTLVGFGVGLLVIGISTSGRNEWRGPPPGETFTGVGAGLLSGGGMLLVLFYVPTFFKRQRDSMFLDEAPILARPAPRASRHELEEIPIPARAAPRLPRLETDDSAAPPRTAPPHEEPGTAGFYQK